MHVPVSPPGTSGILLIQLSAKAASRRFARDKGIDGGEVALQVIERRCQFASSFFLVASVATESSHDRDFGTLRSKACLHLPDVVGGELQVCLEGSHYGIPATLLRSYRRTRLNRLGCAFSKRARYNSPDDTGKSLQTSRAIAGSSLFTVAKTWRSRIDIHSCDPRRRYRHCSLFHPNCF